MAVSVLVVGVTPAFGQEEDCPGIVAACGSATPINACADFSCYTCSVTGGQCDTNTQCPGSTCEVAGTPCTSFLDCPAPEDCIAVEDCDAGACATGPLGACTAGGGLLDAWATFVATETSARIRTDLGSTGTDSDYVVYSVDQGDVCNSGGWSVIGCSEDEAPPYLGDITVNNLTVGDTYLIQVGSWADRGGCDFELDISCFTPPPFPALPGWGLLGLAVLLLGGGAVIFGRLRIAA